MVAARMSGSMAETQQQSVVLGFDSRLVINFFLTIASCTGEHLHMQRKQFPGRCSTQLRHTPLVTPYNQPFVQQQLTDMHIQQQQ